MNYGFTVIKGVTQWQYLYVHRCSEYSYLYVYSDLNSKWVWHQSCCFFFNRNFTTTAPETLENLGFFFFFKRSTVSRVCELWQFIITRIHDCSLEMCLGQFYHACSYYFCFYLLAIFSNKFSYFYFSSYKQTGSFIWATTTLSKHLLRMNEWTLWRHHTTMLTASSHL